ncbi:TetR/AcrR family transcriptional regulator [Natronorubrum halophilum]|uniref:TetR/AcrR family transcriptional regulator n=1 Tax=Natronorubrum halophilum TaxID=1702106 RepID=UPI001EE8294B|nr:TetR/AcrR family transcriptional regulator [Natronorubrum halophilum]
MAAQSRSDETTDAIMRATYQALCKHGYPDTTISNIAAEFDKSKGLLYYHYDDKDDLLTDFLRYLLERFDSNIKDDIDGDPYEQLIGLIERILPARLDDDQLRFRQAFFEIRSQAPHSEAYHDLIAQNDDLLRSELTSVIERGIDSGQFRSVDPEQTVDFILTMSIGTMERVATLEDEDLYRRNRRSLIEYIDRQLLEESDGTE